MGLAGEDVWAFADRGEFETVALDSAFAAENDQGDFEAAAVGGEALLVCQVDDGEFSKLELAVTEAGDFVETGLQSAADFVFHDDVLLLDTVVDRAKNV